MNKRPFWILSCLPLCVALMSHPLQAESLFHPYGLDDIDLASGSIFGGSGPEDSVGAAFTRSLSGVRGLGQFASRLNGLTALAGGFGAFGGGGGGGGGGEFGGLAFAGANQQLTGLDPLLCAFLIWRDGLFLDRGFGILDRLLLERPRRIGFQRLRRLIALYIINNFCPPEPPEPIPVPASGALLLSAISMLAVVRGMGGWKGLGIAKPLSPPEINPTEQPPPML